MNLVALCFVPTIQPCGTRAEDRDQDYAVQGSQAPVLPHVKTYPGLSLEMILGHAMFGCTLLSPSPLQGPLNIEAVLHGCVQLQPNQKRYTPLSTLFLARSQNAGLVWEATPRRLCFDAGEKRKQPATGHPRILVLPNSFDTSALSINQFYVVFRKRRRGRVGHYKLYPNTR